MPAAASSRTTTRIANRSNASMARRIASVVGLMAATARNSSCATGG
jgi:hypothetical protein